MSFVSLATYSAAPLRHPLLNTDSGPTPVRLKSDCGSTAVGVLSDILCRNTDVYTVVTPNCLFSCPMGLLSDDGPNPHGGIVVVSRTIFFFQPLISDHHKFFLKKFSLSYNM